MISLILYLAALIAGVVLSFIMRDSLIRRISRVTTIVLTIPIGLGGICLILLLVLAFVMQPPSLGSLQRHFQDLKADLQEIVRMSDEDSSYSRIAPTFLDRDSTGGAFGRYMEGDPKAGLDESRWNAYRAIYKRADVKLGVQRDPAGDAFVMIDSFGLLNRGHVTGYVYCKDSQAQANRFQPCIQNRDEGSHQFTPSPREEGYSFRRIEGSWFAYDEGPS